MIVIVCGVSGVGKTTVGRLLAERLGLPFYDADDCHPEASIEKMKSGVPLDEADRQPWLEALAGRLSNWERGAGAVLACSALRSSYRATLGSQLDEPVCWVMLAAEPAVLAERLAARTGHFFRAELLQSQIDALEPVSPDWVIDANRRSDEIVRDVLNRIKKGGWRAREDSNP